MGASNLFIVKYQRFIRFHFSSYGDYSYAEICPFWSTVAPSKHLPMAYKVSVSKYRWKEGTPWAVNIPATVGGKRRREFFKTRLAAERRRSELTDKITYQGINAIRAGSLPVGEAIEDYLANKAGLSQRHLEGLLLYCGRMRAAWGKLPVSSISFRDVEKFLRNPSWGPRTRWNALTACARFSLLVRAPKAHHRESGEDFGRGVQKA
jgi:hypothetical protein